MIAIAAASSRRRLRLRSSSDNDDESFSSSSSSYPSSHQRFHSRDPSRPEPRHRPPSKKTPPVEHTRHSGYHCRASIIRSVSEEEYADAMAARARLDARLYQEGLIMPTSRAANSGSAPAFKREHSTSTVVQNPRTEASSTMPSSGVRDVHGTHNLQVAAKSRPCFSGSTCSSMIEQVEEGQSEPEECSICLERLSRGKVLICLPCKHMFHDACLLTWMKAHLQCPNCRSRVLKLGYLQSSPAMSKEMFSTMCDMQRGINVDILSTPWRHTSRTSQQRTTIL